MTHQLRRTRLACALACVLSSVSGCTEDARNNLSRRVQNWTGTNGVLDVFSGDKILHRFIKIDKMTTASDGGDGSPYRFGYGLYSADLSYQPVAGAKRIYFEVSDHSTTYVFYENPE